MGATKDGMFADQTVEDRKKTAVCEGCSEPILPPDENSSRYCEACGETLSK